MEGFPNTSFNDATNAANFMVEMVHRHPYQVSIFSAGALTNIALAVRMDPSFASMAKELVIMGGYVDVDMFRAFGNHGQANINSDVYSFHQPLNRKILIDVVPSRST